MGYRMQIDTIEKESAYYGSKLFGYYENEKLKSFDYLKRLGCFDDETVFCGCGENLIKLTADEFRKFIELYNDDMNTVYATKPMYKYKKNDFINQNEIQSLLKTDKPKILSWG